jgi:hypothetical protein
VEVGALDDPAVEHLACPFGKGHDLAVVPARRLEAPAARTLLCRPHAESASANALRLRDRYPSHKHDASGWHRGGRHNSVTTTLWRLESRDIATWCGSS